jgi:hypothetical protein
VVAPVKKALVSVVVVAGRVVVVPAKMALVSVVPKGIAVVSPVI